MANKLRSLGALFGRSKTKAKAVVAKPLEPLLVQLNLGDGRLKFEDGMWTREDDSSMARLPQGDLRRLEQERDDQQQTVSARACVGLGYELCPLTFRSESKSVAALVVDESACPHITPLRVVVVVVACPRPMFLCRLRN